MTNPDLSAEVRALRAENEKLREALLQAEGWFRDYERQHRANGTPEADEKAQTNWRRAAYLRAALSNPDPAEGEQS